MKIFLRDQGDRLASYLDDYRERRLSFGTPPGFPEKVQRRHVSVSRRDLRSCELGFLFRYDLFPPAILKFSAEWMRAGRTMRPGDTIVQQAEVPPGFGLHLVFGVRVLAVYADEHSAGFSYGTLEGHPETGVNEFSFEAAPEGITAVVRTRARPGLRLSRLLGPIVTRPYVAFCNRRALGRMGEQFLRANPSYT